MVQARLNAGLVEVTGNPLQVSLLNLAAAALVSSVVIAVSPTLRTSWRMLIAAARSGALRPWQLTGGALGGYYIAIQGSVSLAVGVAVFTVAVVAGQTATALVVDRLGFGPMGRQDISMARVFAAALAVVAVLVAGSGRWHETSVGSVGLLLVLAASAGAASAFQSAVNGRVGAYTRNGITAAWMNFMVGAVLMVGVVSVVDLVSGTDWAPIPAGDWWMAVAGVFGLAYIATIAWVVRFVGVLVSSLLTLTGLLVGSILVDLLAPTRGSAVTWQLLVAVVLTAAAVALASLRRATAVPAPSPLARPPD
jgi:transporter family-2 protein